MGKLHPRPLRVRSTFAATVSAGLFAGIHADVFAQELEARATQTLPMLTVAGSASVAERNRLPATTEGVGAAQLAETVNLVNTEDALKYLPGVLVRKRHLGDTQAPMTTRTSGPGQSAHSLIYADGVLLSALIGNNNGSASPRWGMVAPEEIERIDVMYGPFSAAYAGNSIGAVAVITTRMPDKWTASVKLLGSTQSFDLYATHARPRASEISALAGDRSGNFSWWLSANHLDSRTQPLAIVTAVRGASPGTAGTPVSGAFADVNRTGAPIAVLGAGGIEHKLQDNLKLKLGYDIAPSLRGLYTFGMFRNDARADAQSDLRDGAGNAVYSGTVNIDGYAYSIPASAFSNNVYGFREQHTMHSLSMKSAGERWSWEAVASLYEFGKDVLRTPSLALPMARDGGAGSITAMDGTGWSTFDLSGTWQPAEAQASHRSSFGAHRDGYTLVNTRFDTSDWIGGQRGAVAADARGKTRTQALWIQDVVALPHDLQATLGGRYEWWRAYDGINYSAAPALNVAQPRLDASHFSPKASIAWQAEGGWRATASVGKAYRFPTVGELYQTVTTGPTLSVPNPNLEPERAWSSELAIERTFDREANQGPAGDERSPGKIRLSLFQENLRDALLSQSAPLLANSSTLFNFVQNIDRLRTRGIEVVAQLNDIVVRGLDLSGSITRVDSKILADPVFPAAVGRQTPQIPKWRATAVATWRPDGNLALTLAARYSDRLYANIDNSDVVTHTWQGFDRYFVVDARIGWRIGRHWNVAVGIDNLENRKYFLFHPFPQRSLVAEAKFAY